MTVKTFFLILIFLSSITVCTAQKDTIYLDANGKKVSPALAATYEIHVKVKKSQIETIEEYDAVLGYKKRFYMLKKLPQWTMEEVRITAARGGYPEFSKKEPRIIIYSDSTMMKHGTYIEWYASGALKTRATYQSGRLEGDLTTFHANDKLMQVEVYHLDSLKKGVSFDSLGTEIAHIPFFELPKYPKGNAALFKYLGQTFRYPINAIQAGAQETIFVSFTIGKTGKVTDVKSLNNKSRELGIESVRTIKTITKWTPAILDGKPIEMTFLMPITYSIE